MTGYSEAARVLHKDYPGTAHIAKTHDPATHPANSSSHAPFLSTPFTHSSFANSLIPG
jgi:hypothetical protein